MLKFKTKHENYSKSKSKQVSLVCVFSLLTILNWPLRLSKHYSTFVGCFEGHLGFEECQ